MLIIRTEQIAQLAADEVKRFNVRLQRHLLVSFPLQTAMASEQSLGEFVDFAMTQAAAVGIDTEATVQSFADHMVLLGADFHRNPLYADIAAPLFDQDLVSPIQRLDLVYDRAWSYLDATRGPDAANLIRAMARLRATLGTPKEGWSVTTDDLIQTLHRIFPEKCGAHSVSTLTRFCGGTLARAWEDGFEQPPARVLYVCVAFLAGLGFFRDPLVLGGALHYAQALAAERDPARRTKLLGRGVALYLDTMLAKVRGASLLIEE
ncbi:hypothetical protein [uncultured Lamprocystis sp.]|jgi:hypothetical protein|uniref:hypothetical protein n=1 Tax=uncultured Lamprocystis sp. TaxID=543132 RepID=UPI0025CBA97D|nr:hypothetical protein [uncultured Lamprocystis sp.]